MKSLKSLDDAAKAAKVSRRLMQQWLSEGKLKRWQIPGNRRRFVDMREVAKLMQPKPLPAKGKP